MGSNDLEENSGEEHLAFSWFNALDELNEIITGDASVDSRIQACSVILDYAARMNQGLGDPWIPFKRPEDEDEDE